MTDTINWKAAVLLDRYLDEGVPEPYRTLQPLAQDWARIAKVGEEFGEVVDAYISYTGQNPRKLDQPQKAMWHVYEELADVLLTGVYAMLHFAKDPTECRDIIVTRQMHQNERVGLEWPQ